MRVVLPILFIVLISACNNQQSNDQISQAGMNPNLQFNAFQYSKHFAERLGLSNTNINPKWSKLFAVKMERANNSSVNQCFVKIYFDDQLNFVFPAKENIISIQGARYDEIFFFTKKLNDKDIKHVGDLSVAASNIMSIEGMKQNKVAASTGLSIDYLLRDFLPGMHYLKTTPTLCAVFEEPLLSYRLTFSANGHALEYSLSESE